MVGIASKDDGSVSTGNVRPADERFFIDVHLAGHTPSLCQAGDKEYFHWYLCDAKYEVQINDKERFRSDGLTGFVGVPPFYGQFTISGDGSYTRLQTILTTGGYYPSTGKCSKV